MCQYAFKIKFPDAYVKPVMLLDFPWIRELRNPENKQNTDGYLKNPTGECCLGLASRLQGRLKPDGCDGSDMWVDADCDFVGSLSENNPLNEYFSKKSGYAYGNFPSIVSVQTFLANPDGSIIESLGVRSISANLAGCNDAGLAFPQIAEIILAIWDVQYTDPCHQH